MLCAGPAFQLHAEQLPRGRKASGHARARARLPVRAERDVIRVPSVQSPPRGFPRQHRFPAILKSCRVAYSVWRQPLTPCGDEGARGPKRLGWPRQHMGSVCHPRQSPDQPAPRARASTAPLLHSFTPPLLHSSSTRRVESGHGADFVAWLPPPPPPQRAGARHSKQLWSTATNAYAATQHGPPFPPPACLERT